MEADDVERARVAVNRQAGEEAGATRQPRAGGPGDLPVGEATTGDDGADAGGAAGSTPGEWTRQCLNRRQDGWRAVARPEPEVRVSPPREMSQRPNGAVKRRAPG